MRNSRSLKHTEPVSAVGVTKDGKLVVTGSHDRTVRVWDAANGKQVRVFQGHLDKVTALAVRPDGRQVATGSEDGSGSPSAPPTGR